MVALVATIHVFARERLVAPFIVSGSRHQRQKTWMVGTSPTMTAEALPGRRRGLIVPG